MTKTTERKELQGTDKLVREKKLGFLPLVSVPVPTYKLTKDQKLYFEYICNVLLAKGVLTAAFIPDITRASIWWGLFWVNKKEVDKNGGVQTTQTGYSQKTGYLTVMDTADDKVRRFQEKYGLNLIDSDKIPRPQDRESASLDGIVNGKLK